MNDKTPSSPQTLDSLEGTRAVTVVFVTAARREVHLYSPDLEPRLYDHPPFLDALKELALSGRRARVHILTRDTGPAVTRGHRLIELSRQLSTFIEIRRVDDTVRERSDAFLVVDRRAVIHRPNWTRHEGTAEADNPLQARLLIQEFDTLWETATPDPELRRLHL